MGRGSFIIAALLAGAALVAVGLVACGDSGNGTPPTATAPGTPTLGNEEPTAVPTVAPANPPEVDVTPTVTESGLKIIDIKVGTGKEVVADQPTQAVTVHYTGWLAEDGTKFNSSLDLGQPTTLPVDQFIDGWQEGLIGMRVGGIRRLIIPPELAYGAAGSPPLIPANATLIFDIELLNIQ
ncbi:MAG: FKBP-type peptidyl-prolyl cis-trans isomerase [Dehalococcoidia bacterium]